MRKKLRPPELLQPLPKKAIHDWQRGVSKKFLTPGTWKPYELGLLLNHPLCRIEASSVEQDYFEGKPATVDVVWNSIEKVFSEHGGLWRDRWNKIVCQIEKAMQHGELPSQNGIITQRDALLWAIKSNYPLPPEFVGWAETQPQKGPSPATAAGGLEAREHADGSAPTGTATLEPKPMWDEARLHLINELLDSNPIDVWLRKDVGGPDYDPPDTLDDFVRWAVRLKQRLTAKGKWHAQRLGLLPPTDPEAYKIAVQAPPPVLEAPEHAGEGKPADGKKTKTGGPFEGRKCSDLHIHVTGDGLRVKLAAAPKPGPGVLVNWADLGCGVTKAAKYQHPLITLCSELTQVKAPLCEVPKSTLSTWNDRFRKRTGICEEDRLWRRSGDTITSAAQWFKGSS